MYAIRILRTSVIASTNFESPSVYTKTVFDCSTMVLKQLRGVCPKFLGIPLNFTGKGLFFIFYFFYFIKQVSHLHKYLKEYLNIETNWECERSRSRKDYAIKHIHSTDIQKE